MIPVMNAAQEQGEIVRKILEEMEADPRSHSQDELKTEEEKLMKLKNEREAEKQNTNKPDNTSKWFADWDRPNVFGLTPNQALFNLYLPIFISFVFVVLLQAVFIAYIAEVVQGKIEENQETWMETAGVVCYGSRLREWDSKNPIYLRIICLLTFLTEIVRVRVESLVQLPFASLLFV